MGVYFITTVSEGKIFFKTRIDVIFYFINFVTIFRVKSFTKIELKRFFIKTAAVKGTVMQIEKALINDRLCASEAF